VVTEAAVLSPSQARPDDLGRVPPLLHRHGRDARQHDRLAIYIARPDHVTDREHLRVPRKGQIGFNRDAAGSVPLRSGEFGEPAGEP
jgi:hypothetical protein